MSDWVKCSERNPTDDKWKWVTIVHGKNYPIRARYVTLAQYYVNTWFGTDECPLSEQPVAWMDIDVPDAYREGK